MAATLYATHAGFGAADTNLWIIDPATMLGTSVGDTGHLFTGLAFDTTDPTKLYGVTGNTGSDQQTLFLIDPATGGVTSIGALGTTIADITFDAAGQLYGWKVSTKRLATIDKATGAVVEVGPSGISGSANGNGIAVDPADDNLVWLFPKGGGADVYNVNKTTGAATDMGTMFPAVAIGGNIGSAAFGPSDVLYGLNTNIPSVLFTLGPDDGFGEYPQTLVGTMPNDDGSPWDAMAWSPDAAVAAIPVGRVLIAFDDPALEPDPAWTRIDDTDNLVAGIDIRRGRQTEFDITETSTATVYVNDTDGLFDPANASSPYFGNLDGKQILLQLWNPVAEEWSSLWRGLIDDYGFDFNPATNPDGSMVVANVAIQCVDLFDYLGSVEMLVGVFGDVGGPDGVVFYEDTDFQTRLEQLADDARLPADRYRFFTGNVDVQEMRYDPGDSVLAAMRDTVDAEFPGVGQLFCDRFGRVCAHGRFARFDPEGTAAGSDWIFTRWPAGDGAAIAGDSTRAQIRPPLSWARSRSRIYNAATAWPRYAIRPAVSVIDVGQGSFTDADLAGQIVVDTTSRDAYGYRAYPAMSDLITLRGTTTGNDAKTETKLFASYYVANYKNPRTRVEALTFKSIDPDDPRGPATWGLLAGFDISDIVELKHGYPGSATGIDEDFYIEGSEMSIRPLNPRFDMVVLTLNVSPAAYFTDDVFSP